MANNRRKSAAVLLAVIGVAGLSLASAANLTVTSDDLAAGQVSVEGCDDAVHVSYTHGWSGATYQVTGLTIEDINLANCNGDSIQVRVVAGASNTLYTGSVSAATWSPAAFTAVPAADLGDVAVVLSN